MSRDTEHGASVACAYCLHLLLLMEVMAYLRTYDQILVGDVIIACFRKMSPFSWRADVVTAIEILQPQRLSSYKIIFDSP